MSFLFILKCFNNICSKTALGRECSEASDCRGTDAPYCSEYELKCVTEPKGAYCDTVDDCGGLPYCRWYLDGESTKICFSTLEGAPCYFPSDCEDSDAQYCDYDSYECSKTPAYENKTSAP